MLSTNNISKKNLQVGILDNGRQGRCYAAIVIATRVPRQGAEDAVQESYNNSQGIPYLAAQFSQGGIKANSCVIVKTSQTLPADTIPEILARVFGSDKADLEDKRFLFVPLGTNVWTDSLNTQALAQVNADLRQYTTDYYNYKHYPEPHLIHLGKIALPHPERYCDFKEGETFSELEMQALIEQRTKATLAVSHGMPVTSRFDVKMVDLIPHTPIPSVKYKKQTGEMVDLPVAQFEKKVARARGIPTFKFSSQLRITKLLEDFNDGQLPAPAWTFSDGLPLALSVQHDFYYLSNPTHPYLKIVNPLYFHTRQALINPMPDVYFSYFGEFSSYGVFAAKDIPAMTLIDIYSGDFTDNHPDKQADCYCYRPQIPGYQYGYCQGVYAFETGNVTTLINSAANDSQEHDKTPIMKANVGAHVTIFKKTPLVTYYSLKAIPKDTQLLTNYEELVKEECPRHFTFFGNGSTVCANAQTKDYFSQDHRQGRELYKQGDYLSAKKVLRVAYHLAKACYQQFPASEAGKIRLVFASICEDLSMVHNQLGNKHKAKLYLQHAIDLRQGLQKQTPENEARLNSLAVKLAKISDALPRRKRV
jgi:hypothetical protein